MKDQKANSKPIPANDAPRDYVKEHLEAGMVYTKRQLEDALCNLNPDYDVASRIAHLTQAGHIRQIRVPNTRRPLVLYTCGQVPLEYVLMAVHPNAYLCHHTAACIHGLSSSASDCVYFNVEQTLGSAKTGKLEQSRIDAAFRRSPRVTSNRLKVGNQEVWLINGKNTGRLGVVETTLKRKVGDFPVRVTNVERTLIDLITRPSYSGGVRGVLEAFKQAGKLPVDTLLGMLRDIGHVYPYHQALGFYLERSGHYDSAELALIQDQGLDFDFYLTHDMSDPVRVDRWRLYVPSDPDL